MGGLTTEAAQRGSQVLEALSEIDVLIGKIKDASTTLPVSGDAVIRNISSLKNM